MGLALMGIPRKATFVSVDLSTVEKTVKQVTHTFYVGYTRNIRLSSTVECTKFISFVRIDWLNCLLSDRKMIE